MTASLPPPAHLSSLPVRVHSIRVFGRPTGLASDQPPRLNPSERSTMRRRFWECAPPLWGPPCERVRPLTLGGVNTAKRNSILMSPAQVNTLTLNGCWLADGEQVV